MYASRPTTVTLVDTRGFAGMKGMNGLRATMTGAAVIGLTVVLSPAAHAAPAQAAANCPSGYVCFWEGANQTGSKCQWQDADNDWLTSPGVCSWASSHTVGSIWNAGTSSASGVAYWTTANYSGSRKGCTPQGHGGNLAGNYTLRSHKWVTGSCG